MHLVLSTSVIISLLTGFRIAAHHHEFLHWLKPVLPQGDVFSLHMLAASIMCSTVLAYVCLQIYCYRKKVTYRLIKPSKTKVWDYHRPVQTFGLTLCGLAVATGILIHLVQDTLPIVNPITYKAYLAMGLRYAHLIVAALFIAYIFMHAASYFVLGGISFVKRFFIPQVKQLRSLKVLIFVNASLVCLGTFIVLLDYGFNGARWFAHKLKAARIDDSQWIEIDGVANDEAWQTAKSIKLFTFGGTGFYEGTTEIQLKSLHNSQEIYFHVTWEDPSESIAHLPIVKTANGWTVKHDGFQYFNETKHYEDKLAILISRSCSIAAAGTAHLGRKPLRAKPANWHGKGYHYSKSAIKHDLWHWKAVRTNGKGQADDNYIGPPEPSTLFSRRYTAGYQQDTKQSGAYIMNWQLFRPEGVQPKRLPRDHLFRPESKSQLSQPPSYGTWFDYAAYRQQLDNFPAGLVIPSVLYRSNQFEGDRGDVRARGVWSKGFWSLELVRRKNTQSDNDVAVTDGTCIWVSAFDHAQIGHTRHLRPIEINF
ncbi:ethylbenzene dehydrogenase-related protein [Exilibacterium tricleocarpae]|nr:ethylbenzene dehydrogenase-related protein [Exilibacterium tricleocarpae]